jgi:lysophospholipid acyltransferase (LPLAT)-like uncharacterized protein
VKKHKKSTVRTAVVSTILKLLYSTNKYHLTGKKNIQKVRSLGSSIIISTWHSNLLSVFYNLRNLDVHALAGTHNDAELISQVALKWGWKMIRGSSKEDGSKAYKGILKTLSKPKNILFITPDGPTGPAKKPKPGIIRAAQATQSAIIPTSVFSTRNWGFTNWDTFYLEKPFGEIFINYGDPIFLDRSLTFKKAVYKFEKAMDKSDKINLLNANQN